MELGKKEDIYNNEIISIITPMYNASKYIGAMIESVLNQTYSNWELIIVDDYSTDNCTGIVKKYCKLDNRIKLIELNENRGPAHARNIAIDNSVGRYIAFLDSDDLWKKEKLEKQIKTMIENNCAVSCTSYEIIKSSTLEVLKNFNVPRRIDYKDMLRRNYFSCDTVMIDRRHINDVKMESYYKHEDYITWLKVIKQSKYAIGIQENLAQYRISEDTRSSNKIKNIKPQFEIYYNIEKIGILKSVYYTIGLCVLSLFKYSFKFKKINIRGIN